MTSTDLFALPAARPADSSEFSRPEALRAPRDDEPPGFSFDEYCAGSAGTKAEAPPAPRKSGEKPAEDGALQESGEEEAGPPPVIAGSVLSSVAQYILAGPAPATGASGPAPAAPHAGSGGQDAAAARSAPEAPALAAAGAQTKAAAPMAGQCAAPAGPATPAPPQGQGPVANPPAVPGTTAAAEGPTPPPPGPGSRPAPTGTSAQPSPVVSPGGANPTGGTTPASPGSAPGVAVPAPAADPAGQAEVPPEPNTTDNPAARRGAETVVERHPEKSAAPPAAKLPARAAAEENNLLVPDVKQLSDAKRSDGTSTALHAGMLRSPTLPSSRWTSRSDRPFGGEVPGVAEASTNEASLAWKGWTNGGGDRASTAAQFVRLGDSRTNLPLGAFPAPSPGLVRSGHGSPVTPTAPVTPLFPTEPSALLAPVGAAIERMVLHGREQLSLTVRFEQGGSLSLRLAMRDGEVTTQIHTDVPGLEGALRSAWTQLSHEWEGRGIRLAHPEFSGSGHGHQQQQAATGDERRAPARDFAHEHAAAFPARGASASPARAGTVAPVRHETTGTTSVAAAAAGPRGLQTWA